MKIAEWFGEMPKQTKKGWYGYLIKIYKNGVSYFKYGTTTNPHTRFRASDYKQCSRIDVLYLVQFNSKYEMMNFEELNKSWLREQLDTKKIKGMRWVPNDRFTYNKLPKQLPIMYKIDKPMFLQIK